jgi:hypothetical protein
LLLLHTRLLLLPALGLLLLGCACVGNSLPIRGFGSELVAPGKRFIQPGFWDHHRVAGGLLLLPGGLLLLILRLGWLLLAWRSGIGGSSPVASACSLLGFCCGFGGVDFCLIDVNGGFRLRGRLLCGRGCGCGSDRCGVGSKLIARIGL